MVVYEIIYFEAYTNDQYMCHKNNIAQLYFMLKTAKLLENFSSTPKDGSDIHTDFPPGSESLLCAIMEICNYQRHPQVNWKNSNVA